jgi:mRNA interferase HigB
MYGFQMRVIARRTLREFWNAHADAEQPLKAWFKAAKQADWRSAANVRAAFPRVSTLKAGRVVFDIKGNTYRLVVRINFKYAIVYIRFVGTHADYDKIDADTV